ncbi:hypothetical protein QQP08_013619 [Theobroma cacao]|nr:hypothetical protein QQP08_013619 [Theobroma cacao]
MTMPKGKRLKRLQRREGHGLQAVAALALSGGDFGHAATGGDTGGEGDACTNTYKTLGKLEGRVYVALVRVGYNEEMTLWHGGRSGGEGGAWNEEERSRSVAIVEQKGGK